MSRIYENLTELIGGTPLVRLSGLETALGSPMEIVAKLEYFNPLGSVKDRVAKALLDAAERDGLLVPGGTVIEPTSGNTGVGLAFCCACRGYRLILTMPETMSAERKTLLSALGAELILTAGADGMSGAVKKAEELAAEIPGAFIPQQFRNPANPAIHEQTTAREILRDTDSSLDFFIAAIGTGGTISGTGRALKAAVPGVCVVGVEPAESPLLTAGTAGPHKIQGIGANFIPEAFDSTVPDEILTIRGDDAQAMTRLAARTEGLLVGISSGAALSAAAMLARREENSGKRAVVLLPDTGERYLSTGLFDTNHPQEDA